jgi:hypothetical protein
MVTVYQPLSVLRQSYLKLLKQISTKPGNASSAVHIVGG